MSKAVLLSIQPKWCELIAIGIKTIEVRKTRPKLETPFKCYIYQTKRTWVYNIYSAIADWQGKVIGEFVCDSIIKISYNKNGYGLDDSAINGVIAKSCMSENELYRYLKGKLPYLWHISDLEIYDKPKELGEFRYFCGGKCDVCKRCYCRNECTWICDNSIKRPPQSWCYMEDLEDCQ